MDNIGENIYAKNANSAKSKSRKLSTPNQAEKRRTSSISNELSSLANQLNVTNDIVSDEPEAEDQAQPVEEVADDTKVDEAADASNKIDLVVDDVDCSMTNENIEIDSSIDSSSASEFVHLRKTTTALQSYLEQFQMENIKSNENSETFDATEELLKMLDKENNEP